MSEAIYIDKVVGQKKCPECGKMFDWFGDCWVYKGKKKDVRVYYCSWKCWRAEDKRKETKMRGESYHGW